jgi:hypothetical protein
MGSASVLFFFATSQTAYPNTRPELVLALKKARKENKPWHVQIECETFYSHSDWRTYSYRDSNVRQAITRDCRDKSRSLSVHTECKQQSRGREQHAIRR